jgi:hypothetical protein
MRSRLLAILLVFTLALTITACEVYVGPPIATIVGTKDGHLTDPKAPIVVHFSRPVDPATLNVQLARYTVDIEGNLADEDNDPSTELDLFFSHELSGDVLGESQLSADRKTLTIIPQVTLPIGAQLVILLGAGLADDDGLATRVRKRLLFSYTFDLKCDKPVSVFESGAYFLLVDVKKPISAQIQLLGILDLDEETGAFRGQFTKGNRRNDQTCPTPCESTERCRLLPQPGCVAPSERAGTPEEYPEYVPNVTPPTGFSFFVTGCVIDQDAETTVFITAPVDVEVQSPPVTLRNAVLTVAFTRDTDGALRGTGSLAADDVLLGDMSSGSGEAGLAGRSIPADRVPANIPKPPPAPAP